jgi:hypothetical protein
MSFAVAAAEEGKESSDLRNKDENRIGLAVTTDQPPLLVPGFLHPSVRQESYATTSTLFDQPFYTPAD